MRKLLLDEMLSAQIATRLVAIGMDVLSIQGDAGLRSTPDAEVVEIAAREDRIIVTENIRDFAPLAAAWAGAGRTHPGMLFVSAKTYPPTRGRLGRITAALLARHVGERWPDRGTCEFL